MVLGFLSALFDGNSVTPIIIDYRSSLPEAVASNETSDSDGEFLNLEASHEEMEDDWVLKFEEPADVEDDRGPKLEESSEALEILQEIEREEEQALSKPLQYEASEIPDALNDSLKDFFKAIDGISEEENDSEAPLSRAQGSVLSPENDLLEEIAPAVSSVEDFEAAMPSIDDMLDQFTHGTESTGAKILNFPYGENLPLPPREYWALQQKYGAEVVSKVTTTPGKGGTGEYDCMIGRVVQKENMKLLQYGDHFIPLKGMDGIEGVYLIEGMFIKPDLFFVSNHTDLAEHTVSLGQAAEM